MIDGLLLNELKPGEAGRVVEVLSSGDMRRRLQDLGMIPGTKVECLSTSPLGDPKAYQIRGAIIAIRSMDSKGIKVNKLSSGGEA